MNFWKLISITLMSGALLFSLNGCSSEGGPEKNSVGTEIRAVTYAGWNPFEYLDKGQVVGFDVDLIHELGVRTNKKIILSDISWEALFEKVRQGQSDLAISGVTITADREKTYNFSRPYFVSRSAIITKDPAIWSAHDLLMNKIIGVQNGSTEQEGAEKILGKNNPRLKTFPSAMKTQMLLGGQIDAFVGDETAIIEIAKMYPEEQFRIIYDDKIFKPQYFGILYPKSGDPKIRAAMDKALGQMFADGSYVAIYKKWFGKEPSEEMLDQLMKGIERNDGRL